MHLHKNTNVPRGTHSSSNICPSWYPVHVRLHTLVSTFRWTCQWFSLSHAPYKELRGYLAGRVSSQNRLANAYQLSSSFFLSVLLSGFLGQSEVQRIVYRMTTRTLMSRKRYNHGSIMLTQFLALSPRGLTWYPLSGQSWRFWAHLDGYHAVTC